MGIDELERRVAELDRESWVILGCVALLAIGFIMQTRAMREMDQEIRDQQEETAFLRTALKTMEEMSDG